MKRNVSLIILACEIAAIVVLHAIKMHQQQNTEISDALSKAATLPTPHIKQHYPLLSIK